MELQQRAKDLWNIPALLAQALRDDPAAAGFQAHYQPIVGLRDATPVAVEALARWWHPQVGNIDPDVFMPVAERVGLAGALDDFVLRSACADAPSLVRAFDHPVDVHVNICAERPTSDGRPGPPPDDRPDALGERARRSPRVPAEHRRRHTHHVLGHGWFPGLRKEDRRRSAPDEQRENRGHRDYPLSAGLLGRPGTATIFRAEAGCAHSLPQLQTLCLSPRPFPGRRAGAHAAVAATMRPG